MVRFKYDNDTVYASLFDRNVWVPTFVNLRAAVQGGGWIPCFVHLHQIRPDSLLVSFGCAGTVLASIGVGEDTTGAAWNAGSVYCWATSESSSARVSDMHVFSSSDTASAINVWRAFFSPAYLDNGPVMRIPLMIHNIVYDPPGNASYSTCTFDTTTTTTTSFDWAANSSASLELGFKGSLEMKGGFLGIVEAGSSMDLQATVKAEVHFAYSHSNGTEVSLMKSSSTSSMTEPYESSFIGPARGDVVVYQSFAFRNSMMRRPLMGRFRTATDPKDFVYAVAGGIPLPDSCGPVYYVTVQSLAKDMHGDSASLAFLQREYPFDLNTGKVLASALLPSTDPATGKTTPPRLRKYGEACVVQGNIPVHSSTTRETIVSQDSSFDWGGSLELTTAVWTLAGGYEFTGHAGCDFSVGGGLADGHGSTIEWELRDSDPWDRLKIQPYIDGRFKTICFVVDSENSYTSFPVEANTRPAVSWEYSAVPLCTAYVGQGATVVVNVKNTSPKNILSGLPNSFKFSISAINFPGTFSVYPEDAEIAVGQTVPFTFTFTGAEADSFAQEIRVDCWQPLTNGYSQFNSIKFPLVVRNADVGLVAVIPQDTIVISKGAALSNRFAVKLVNSGKLAGSVISGETAVSDGASASYSTLANPVAPGDTAVLTVTLTGDGLHNAYSVTFWTQLQGEAATKSLHTLVILPAEQVGIAVRQAGGIRELAMQNLGSGRLAVMVPDGDRPQLKLFSISGKLVYSRAFDPGCNTLTLSTLNLPNGYYIVRLQGRRLIQERLVVTRR
jgi:hypothetical protein